MNHGFGNAYGRGFELVVTPLVFGGIGWLIDRAVGTHLVFMIGLAVFAVIGMFVRIWLGYDLEMREHEAELFGKHRRGAAPTAPSSSADAAPGAR